ncbi:MAG: hypothetical protein E7461_08385, partial [Ruminococcaceae bacterium]|nr:hypothetical protein [Oscillospiraceae bacterium]
PSEPSDFGPAADAVAPVAGTAYKLGLVHGTNAKTYYISGGMAQTYYLATNEAAASGLDAYIEAVDGGYNLYVMQDGAKKYINMTVSGTHVNAVYADAAETVYTYDETLKTLKVAATVEGETADYILGTRNDKTYSTVGFCTVSSEPFYCQFFAITASEPSDPQPSEPEATEPQPTEPEATNKVELTVNSLGLASQSYSASTATVGGVGFQWIQLGNYGDGIQVRDKNGNTSTFWNTTAFGAPISKIELVYSSTKDVTYANPDCEIFSFGNGVDNYTYTTKLSTTAGVKTYTITPDAETYTFMKFEHDLGYTMYWDSITIYLADGTVVPGTPSEPEATEPEATEPEVTEPEVTEPTTNAKGSADFSTFDVTHSSGGDSSYTNTHTTTNGWTTVNSAIQAGGTTDANPNFKVFGPDKTHKAVCLNGKVSAPGKLTSPTLTGGINKLTFNYTKCFSDTNLGVTVTITDLATGTTYEKVLEASPANKFDVGEFAWELETAISGDFTIEIVNSCPSANTGNKDRISIWNLNWY